MTVKVKALIKVIVILFTAFIVGFAIGALVKNTYEKSTIKPYEWKTLPIIVNCYGSDFSETQIIRAIHYWTVRGHDIGFYEHNPPGSICDYQNWERGFIIIRKAGMFDYSSDTLASTKRYTSLNVIKGAQIYYRPGSQNLELVSEHELGHALGFVHVEQEGHVMHPLFHKMGEGFWVP